MVLTAGFMGGVATNIAAEIQRFDGGSGSYTITNGVAFRPGDVTTTMLTAKKLRVFVGGVEQAIYTEALNGRHPDGSVKFVLIQFVKTFTGTVSAQIRLGETRQTTDIAKQTLNDQPDGLLYPTDPVFLCAANPLWHSITPLSNRPTGTYWDDFEKHVRSQSPFQAEGWKDIYDQSIANPNGNPVGCNPNLGECTIAPLPDSLMSPTYDPCLRPHYEFHMMTGEGLFLYRGIKWAWQFINWANTRSPAWGIGEQFMLGSLDAMMHYWLTGSATSRDVPITAYNNDPRMFNISAAQMADRTYTNNHGRMHYNKLMNLVIMVHLGLPGLAGSGSGSGEWEPTATTNAAKARLLIDSAISQQYIDGHNTWPDENNGQQNWQVAMRSTAIIAYYKWVSADSDIHDHIKAGYDYINNNYWNDCLTCGPNSDPQLAWSLSDTQGGSPTIAAELNGFMLEPLAWLYKQDGGSAYTSRGDEAMHGLGNRSANWSQAGQNPKFPNECLWGAFAYIAARQGA